MRIVILPLMALLLASPIAAQRQPQQQQRVGARDRAAHERMIVIDAHLDIADHFDDGRWDFAARHRYQEDGTQVDLPRMREGGLDGAPLERRKVAERVLGTRLHATGQVQVVKPGPEPFDFPL